MWAGNELARRWRALVVLGLIAGITAGLAMAAATQARRSETVYRRWRDATGAPDAIVFGTQVQFEEPVDYSPVLKLPEVLDAGQFNLAPVAVKEFEGLGALPTDDQHLYRTLARPLLREGRLPRANSDNEIVVNELAAKKFNLRVGQRVHLISSNDLAAFFGTGEMTGGPTIPATIVGIGNTPLDFIFTLDEPSFSNNGALLAKHEEIPKFPNLVVRLKPGTDVAAFHERAGAAIGLPDVPVRDLGEERKRFVHATDLERTALLLFAAAVVLAGLVLVGQALARTVYAMGAQVRTLTALGLTRRELVTGLVLPTTLTAIVGALVAVATSVLASQRFAVGLSRKLEPDLGRHADPVVLTVGAAAIVVLILVGAALAGLRATRGTAASQTSSGTVLAAIRGVTPLPVALGASLALDPGRGERSTPVRPALAGAIAGVLGIIGALGLVHGIDDALKTPELAGQSYDAVASPDEEHSVAMIQRGFTKNRRLATVARLTRRPAQVGREGLPVYSLVDVRGANGFTVLDGHAPRQPDEVSVAPSSLRALHKKVGDLLTIGGATFRIVGRTLLPETAHSSFDQGAWVTPSGDRRIATAPTDEFPVVLVGRAKAGVTDAALEKSLQADLGGVEVEVGRPLPQDLLLLENVRTLPRVLAAFLGLLGVAALGHALVTSVRRRRHDLAVLKALGFRPRQNAAAVAWQATTVTVIGLLIGLPLGVAIGRVSWRWVAQATPLLYVAPIATAAVLLAIPAALALATALAAWPARRAARLRAVEVLRTE